MAPKKKGKASKFARMTDEERARYLQHRAAVEEEARRRKQELVFTFLKNKFKKEDAFARINLAKIHQQWRQILRKIKITEMKQEVEALQHSFKRLFDSKDKTIKNLVQGLEEAEEQYRRNLYSHVCTMDRLLSLQVERLNYLRKEYHAKRNELMKTRRRHLQEFLVSNSMAQEQMRVIIHASETGFLKSESEARGDFINKTTDWKNVADNEQNLMMSSRESIIEGLAKVYQETTNEYFSSTEERRKHYTSLKAKDDLNCTMIANQAKRLEDGEVLTEKLKEQLTSLQKSYDTALKNFKCERDELSTHFSQLRYNYQMMDKLDKEQLTHLTVVSSNSIQHLEKLIEKAESILRLAQSCRRFETLQEKVVNPGSIHAEPLISQLCIKEDEEADDSGWLKNSLAEYQELNGFWKRFNKVLMECGTLKLHFSALSMENQQLKAALRHYLCSISPSSCVIREGIMTHTDIDVEKDRDPKYNVIETTLKKIIPRESFYKNRPRPVTSVEGYIAVRNYLPF